MSNAYVLYGWHLSYFSGKVRCYLQHKNIPFADTPVDFWTLTRRIRRRFGIPVMPVVVSPEVIWKMQRLLDVHAAMTPAEQQAVRTWLRTLGGERLLDMKIARLRCVGVLVGPEEKAA